MSATSIEWTEATWNPIVGCTIATPGCTNCYAMKMAVRIERMSPGGHYVGTTKPSKSGAVWTGKLALAPDSILLGPLRRRKPTTYFVNSMGDLFHEDAPNEWIDRVFAVMALCPQHTFQVLTKRSARMRAYCSDPRAATRIAGSAITLIQAGHAGEFPPRPWPLPNVWLGVSAEDQRRADERVPDLLATPAAVRFVSAEPLIGPIDFHEVIPEPPAWSFKHGFNGLDWVIVGGESGRGARPMHPDWARSARDQCAAAGVAFFFKQWGAWAPSSLGTDIARLSAEERVWRDGEWTGYAVSAAQAAASDTMNRVGKAKAGRELDGVKHDAMPLSSSQAQQIGEGR